MQKIRIVHLYPEVLNLYGDRGNTICLQKRSEWRGIEAEVTQLGIGDTFSLSSFDLVFIGGGQDFDQEVLLSDLKTGKDREIRSAVEDGLPFLCICGGYQIMGNSYETASGEKSEFLGAVDFYTVGEKDRLIGNYAFRLEKESGGSTVVGFENHSGRTYLGKNIHPLGTILKGNGNNQKDQSEGVRYKNLFGSYCHGPVLPKNPELCDFLLKTALEHKYGKAELEPLRDRFEKQAHDTVLSRIVSGSMSEN